MSPSDQERAKLLLAMLSGHKPITEDDQQLIDDCGDLKTFRVRLVTEGIVGREATNVVQRWQEETQRRIENPDGNELMHALEKLAERQRAIDRDLARIDATLLRELEALDVSCGHLATLRTKLRQTQTSISKCRLSIMQNLSLLPVEN